MKEKLNRLLKECNMKPAQLAQEANLGTSTVDDILKGKTNELNIGVDKMLRIAKVLNVTVEWLYSQNTSISVHNELEPREKQLFDIFRSLNDEGKEKVLDYIHDIADTGKYKKYNPISAEAAG